jgi:hypothetical protein
MASRNSASGSLGCLGLVIVCYPFFWLYDTCSGGQDRRERERAEAETRQVEERVHRENEEERRRAELAELKRVKLARDAEVAKEELVRISKLKPHERATLLVRCVNDDACPVGSDGPETILSAAATKGERKQLEVATAQLLRAKERKARADARFSAALLCCDGTHSPSCTCGNPRRGCCSHHGGVCGCSADQ